MRKTNFPRLKFSLLNQLMYEQQQIKNVGYSEQVMCGVLSGKGPWHHTTHNTHNDEQLVQRGNIRRRRYRTMPRPKTPIRSLHTRHGVRSLHAGKREFDSRSAQTNDFKQMYSCRFLAWCRALIRQDKNWLVQCRDNVTEWDIGSWC